MILFIADCPSDYFWGILGLDKDLDWLCLAIVPGKVDLCPFSSSISLFIYVRLDCYEDSWSLASSSSVIGPSIPLAPPWELERPVVACLFNFASYLASDLTLASICLALLVNCVYRAATGCLGGSFRKGSICFRLKDFMMWSCKAAEFNAAWFVSSFLWLIWFNIMSEVAAAYFGTEAGYR